MRKHIVALMTFLAMSAPLLAMSNPIDVSQLQAEPNPATNGITYVITGMATNLTDKAIKTAFIKFNLYDEQGNLVGNAITMAQGLEPRGTWKFKANATTRFATFKVSEITAYDN